MATRKSRRPYKGVLKVRWKPDPRASEEENKRDYAKVESLKISAIFDHYNIDRDSPDRWRQGFLCLAREHVWPSSARPERKVKWSQPMQDAFLFMLLKMAQARRVPVSMILREITKHSGPSLLFRGKSPGTLRDRFYLLQDKNSAESKRMHNAVIDMPIKDFWEPVMKKMGPREQALFAEGLLLFVNSFLPKEGSHHRDRERQFWRMTVSLQGHI